MNLSFDFGKWLIETRKELNMSQSDLSKLIMIAPRNISSYERGHLTPNLHTVIRVCDCMGYEVQIVPKTPNSLKNEQS